MEMTKQVYKIEQVFIEEEAPLYRILTPFDVKDFAKGKIGNNASESLLVMCLDTKNRVIAYSEVFKGSLNQSTAHPREIFLFAILNNSARIALAHCHPSGVAKPSENDEYFTKRIMEASDLLGIELIDHVIVTRTDDYHSFREEGIINNQ